MKSKLSLLVGVAILAIGLTSCNNKSAKQTEFTGIWSYETLEGNYAELWVTDDSFLAIRNPEKRAGIYDYLRNGDTVMIYAQGMADESHTPLDRFYIKSRKGDKLTKVQDDITTVLTLVEKTKPTLGETEEFENKVLSDFTKRAGQK